MTDELQSSWPQDQIALATVIPSSGVPPAPVPSYYETARALGLPEYTVRKTEISALRKLRRHPLIRDAARSLGLLSLMAALLAGCSSSGPDKWPVKSILDPTTQEVPHVQTSR